MGQYTIIFLIIRVKSVAESVSDNLLKNISIKNSTSEYRNEASSSCSMQDSLQLQHSTNLNIQRSQSAQRFGNNSMASSGENILNPPDEGIYSKQESIEIMDDDIPFVSEDTNYFTNWGMFAFLYIYIY